MTNKEKWEQLVELNQKIKKAQKLYKEIVQDLLPQIWGESISVWDFTVYKQKKTTYKLNWTETESDLCKKFPDHIKFDLTKFKKGNPTTIDLIADHTITESLTIKEKK